MPFYSKSYMQSLKGRKIRMLYSPFNPDIKRHQLGRIVNITKYGEFIVEWFTKPQHQFSALLPDVEKFQVLPKKKHNKK